MRALHVYENLDFKRGIDPKSALGIGIDPKKAQSFIPYIIYRLPEILGTRDIPKDILLSKKSYIHEKYAWNIDSYVRKFLMDRGIQCYPLLLLIDTASYLGYDFWIALRIGLRHSGLPSL